MLSPKDFDGASKRRSSSSGIRKSTGDVCFALARDEPGAVTFTPVVGRVEVGEDGGLKLKQKTLSPVIGERVFSVGTWLSRPSQRWWVPGC
jgi:hypothetical protein